MVLNRAIKTPVGALSMHEETAAAAAAEEAGTTQTDVYDDGLIMETKHAFKLHKV